ncbi:MAG: hypothetical protein E6I75_00315 [Chloroflexi bacterium]|nr:MAG: hypothetical protein E6I75_00315 [Chloroflexota bacterium]
MRPVELQAALAHAANVMAFFAEELGLPAEHWHALEDDYRGRTRRMFDADAGRYRDWLIAEQRFSGACADRPYWGVDPCRYSAQSLTPLLVGEPLAEDEIWRHACPPWTLWPSWTYSLVESAAAAGHYARVGARLSRHHAARRARPGAADARFGARVLAGGLAHLRR